MPSLPKTNLTNEKIDEIIDNLQYEGVCTCETCMVVKSEVKRKILSLIHQAEIKARLDEMTNLLNDATSQHYAMWKQNVESRIEALEKETV